MDFSSERESLWGHGECPEASTVSHLIPKFSQGSLDGSPCADWRMAELANSPMKLSYISSRYKCFRLAQSHSGLGDSGMAVFDHQKHNFEVKFIKNWF